MTSAEIRTQVVDRILQGKTYQEIYDELTAIIPNREFDLAKIIAKVPSRAQRRKYNLPNMVLTGLLLVFVVIKTLLAWELGWEEGLEYFNILILLPIMAFIQMIGVSNWHTGYYYPIALSVIWGFLQMFRPLFVYEFDPLVLLEVGQLAAMLFLAFFIRSKLGGEYKRGLLQVKDAQGNVRTKQTVTWLN